MRHDNGLFHVTQHVLKTGHVFAIKPKKSNYTQSFEVLLIHFSDSLDVVNAP